MLTYKNIKDYMKYDLEIYKPLHRMGEIGDRVLDEFIEIIQEKPSENVMYKDIKNSIENDLEKYKPLHKIGIVENELLYALSEIVQEQRLDAYRDGYVDGYLDGRE